VIRRGGTKSSEGRRKGGDILGVLRDDGSTWAEIWEKPVQCHTGQRRTIP